MPRKSGSRPRPDFVLDVSVAVPWVLRPLWTDYTSRVLGVLIRKTPVVSGSWWCDLLDAAVEADCRGLLPPDQLTNHIATIADFAIQVDLGAIRRRRSEILVLAREHVLPVSSASALELALRTQLPLATIDTRLRTAAARADVSLFTP